MRLCRNGFSGVPKYSLIPEGETANSVRFVLPTIARYVGGRLPDMAHRLAQACAFAGKLRPAVVITPFMSMLSFTASRSRLLFASAGQLSMKARLPESFLLIRGVNEHPLHRTSKASATANRFKITRPKYSRAQGSRGDVFCKRGPQKGDLPGRLRL